MYKLILILASVLFVGCNHSGRLKAQRLKDTLEIVRKSSEFKPLNNNDAYEFINKYYLPRLDTMPTKRKIFIYALKGIDFKEFFKFYKGEIIRKYAGKKMYVPPINLSPPLTLFDEKLSWEQKRLTHTKIIADTPIVINKLKISKSTKAWHREFGYGYMCISYPQYNQNTKRLVIKEWIENRDMCGTGRETTFYFMKIPGGWKEESFHVE